MENDRKLIKDNINVLDDNKKCELNELLLLKEALVRFDKIIKKNIFLENKIEEQSKMIIMGEMIDAIAHQWTQPIGIISLYTKMIVDDFKYGDVDQSYLDNFANKIDLQVGYLLNTLKEFRTFLSPNMEIQEFSISDTVKSSLVLLQDTLKGHQIVVNTHLKNEVNLIGSKIEFENILINLINNSKDAFIEKSIENRIIDIEIFQRDSISYCKIQDNAGGIPENILDKVFDLSFTTKEVGKGTGIGLYMTKRIVNKLNGEITVKNIKNGALFLLSFKNSSKVKR